jgi:uncharacterized membrane protein (DUF373 family)
VHLVGFVIRKLLVRVGDTLGIGTDFKMASMAVIVGCFGVAYVCTACTDAV